MFSRETAGKGKQKLYNCYTVVIEDSFLSSVLLVG